jgi:hypothetical protein
LRALIVPEKTAFPLSFRGSTVNGDRSWPPESELLLFGFRGFLRRLPAQRLRNLPGGSQASKCGHIDAIRKKSGRSAAQGRSRRPQSRQTGAKFASMTREISPADFIVGVR